MDAHGIAYAWLLNWCIGPAEEDPEYHQYFNQPFIGAMTPTGIPLTELLSAEAQFPAVRFGLLSESGPGATPVALLESAHAMHGCSGLAVNGSTASSSISALSRDLYGRRRLHMPVVLHLEVPT